MPSSAHLAVRFWGTRGSLPAPGPATIRYGGNTACVEVVAGDETIILDAGSGIRPLGDHLLTSDVRRLSLLLTHYHWDHIIGFPFFAPAFLPGVSLDVYGEDREDRDVQEILAELMTAPNFPVTMDHTMKATLRFHRVAEGQRWTIGEVGLLAHALSHPNHALGYRIEYGGRVVAYVTDFEHGVGSAEEVRALARDADCLIYDAMYTDREYERYRGWGHSTWQAGAELAAEVGAQRLFLFHHLPSRVDDALDDIAEEARQIFPHTEAAREGQEIRL